ncbi:DUF418 domain-containing protein [Leifsonia sp. McL0607]|uniref:DUF418 domain-containing protein n=1 Tax=Leifsonia sp. McL0607 TaxID=3415672 RepID=UPI003CF42576
MNQTTKRPPSLDRLGFLDALRGVAIAGILLVNLPDMTMLATSTTRVITPTDIFLWFGVQSRVVVIFSLMFGASMWFVARSAERAGRRPWLALLCRLAALLGIGLLHTFAYPGDILRLYAICGLLVLPLMLFTPRLVHWIVGGALTLTAIVVFGFGAGATPGLLLLGYAAAGSGVLSALEKGTRAVRWSFVAAVIVTVPLLWWQTTQPGDPRFQLAGLFVGAGVTAGAAMAVVYITGLSLLWRTRFRAVLTACFSALGRMALTNYIGASLIVMVVSPPFGFPSHESTGVAILLAVAIIVVQSAVSALWLRSFRYGPLEWLWRMATWRSFVPILRRESAIA